MKNSIVGYKCFNGDFTNKYKERIEPKRIYSCDDYLKYRKRGFHFCLRLEDCLRFFEGLKEDIVICRVRVLGNVDWYEADYNGYYDLGCTDRIYIDRPMTREEILLYADGLYEEGFIRFIQGFRLDDEEREYFKLKFSNKRGVLNYLKYYQEGDRDVFLGKDKKLVKYIGK